VAAARGTGTGRSCHWELHYPGDAYVDWVATGALNSGPIAQWSQWWSFDKIFGHNPGSVVRVRLLALT
jgi:hypothetical protein